MQKERYYGSATKNVSIIDKDPPVAFSIAEATNYTEELKDASADVKQRYHFAKNIPQAISHSGSMYLDYSYDGDVGDIIYAETGGSFGGTSCSAGYYRFEEVEYGRYRYTYIGDTFAVTDGITLKGSTTDSASKITYYLSKDDGQNWEPSKEQAGTSYTLKGLTGGTTYTFKMKAVDEAGNETLSNNSITKTLPFTAADIANNSNVGEYFGSQITGHSCAANSSGIGWKMYYADYSNIYLIADNYIPSSLAPRTNSGYTVGTGITNYCLTFVDVAKDYAGSNAITDPRLKRLNNSYYQLLASHNKSSTNSNIKATAYLLDSSKWMASFGSSKVEYAIGAPTLELLFKAYNQKYGSIYMSRANPTTEIGYQVSTDNGNSYGEGFMFPHGEGLYWLSDTSRASWDWIASPSDRSDAISLYYIQQAGGSHVADIGQGAVGLRPVICLKSNIQLEKTGEGVYNIK